MRLALPHSGQLVILPIFLVVVLVLIFFQPTPCYTLEPSPQKNNDLRSASERVIRPEGYNEEVLNTFMACVEFWHFPSAVKTVGRLRLILFVLNKSPIDKYRDHTACQLMHEEVKDRNSPS